MSCQESGDLREVSSLSSASLAISSLVCGQDFADQPIIEARDGILRRRTAQEEQVTDPTSRSGYLAEVIIEGRPQGKTGGGLHEIVKHRSVLAVPPSPDLIVRNTGIDNHQRDFICHERILADFRALSPWPPLLILAAMELPAGTALLAR